MENIVLTAQSNLKTWFKVQAFVIIEMLTYLLKEL